MSRMRLLIPVPTDDELSAQVEIAPQAAQQVLLAQQDT